jgi:hypothetical protein
MCKKPGGKTGYRKWLLLATTAIFILSGIVCLTGCEHHYEKGPVFDATLSTIEKGGPVKDDLIARGLAIDPDDKTGEPGLIKVGEIKKLVDAGVYEIDEEGYLVFGPAYTPPTQ